MTLRKRGPILEAPTSASRDDDMGPILSFRAQLASTLVVAWISPLQIEGRHSCLPFQVLDAGSTLGAVDGRTASTTRIRL